MKAISTTIEYMNEVAISVKQPWAYLLCANIKPIENRTWPLPEKYKGKRVYIHASMARIDYSFPFDYLNDKQKLSIDDRKDELNSWLLYDRGAIIGYVLFSDCVINHPSIWAEKTPDYVVGINPKIHEQITGKKIIYNWVVANAVLFDKPILNVKGRLSFWDCSNIIHSELDDDGKPVCMCNLGIDEKDQVISYGDHFRCKYCAGKWYK